MTLGKEQTVEVLNELLQVSRDGERVFRKARGIANDEELQRAFADSERDCRLAAEQLSEAIRERGGEPEDEGTLSGAFHRAWIDARTTISPDGRKALLREIVRAEREAAARYTRAMGEVLPQDLRPMVRKQAEGAETNLRRYVEML